MVKIKNIPLVTKEEIQEWNGSFRYQNMTVGESRVLGVEEVKEVYGGK